jgi:uncharacterized protein (DUF1800 family)
MTRARTLSRRDFMRLAGLVSASVAVAACGPVYQRLGGPAEAPNSAPEPALDAAALASLRRLTFGPRRAERQRVAEIGLAGWIEEQLAPEALDDGPAAWRLRQFDTLTMSADDLATLSNRLFDNLDTDRVPNELRQATLVRQVYTRRQLNEMLVDFWTDHFNISVEKGDCYFLKTIDDREVIRPHALGRFRDLLWASAHSPAMLVYLDNQANGKDAPNENYAREVMELHTLGVNGGYTQADVMELARAFTGWSVKPNFWRGQFTFDNDQHDQGVKHVLGLRLEPNGQAEAEAVLERLAVHPATAHFIATKLARRFLADEPPAEIVTRAASAFLQTAGDLKAVLRVVLLDGLASNAPLAAPKFKRPVHFVVSALRGLNAETDGGAPLQAYLRRMGQPYFAWPTPDGYPDRSGPWQGNLLPRWQFSLALARNELEGTRVALPELDGSPQALLADLAEQLFGAPLPPAAGGDLLRALRGAGAQDEDLPSLFTAGLLSSPAFQWR